MKRLESGELFPSNECIKSPISNKINKPKNNYIDNYKQ
jgi:hypothetical protein